jgi:hypothetical protein
MLRRSRFRDVVDRQLELFAEDEEELLTEAEAADTAWSEAGADETEELYGDYQLVVDAIADRLHDVRESFAATLADDVADEYRAEFTRAAGKRFPRFASFLEDEA